MLAGARRTFAMLALTLTAAGFVASSAGAAEPLKFSGKAAGCEYSIAITVESKGGSYSAETKKCAAGAIAAKLKGSYTENYVKIGSIEASVTFEGHSLSFEESLGWGFTLPGNLLDGTSLELLLAAVAEGTKNKTVAEAAIKSLLEKAMVELGEVALEKLAEEAGGPLAEAMEPKEEMDGSAKEYCESAEELDPFCEEGTPTTAQPNPEPNGLSEEEADAAAMCPVNLVQKQIVFVCLPSFVMGNLETGSKPIVLLPGGMLICLPIGGEGILSLSTTPTISSKKAILSLGGVIVGVNAKLKANDLALSAGIVDMSGKLTLEGEELNAGTVDIAEAIGALPSEVTENKYYKGYEKVEKVVNLPSPIPTTGSFSVPLLVDASNIEVSASKSLQVGSDTSLITSGRGGAGGKGESFSGSKPGGEAPGGAKEEYGGSHGGYGGYPGTPSGWEAWGVWQERQGRGPTFDSPFAPSEAGAGGAGDTDVGRGSWGGGIVRINAPKASVSLEGTIASDGNDLNDDFSYQDTGGSGAGAGGSIYLTAKSLSGKGALTANGGGYCPTCSNGFGGMGGGGRIAVIYGEEPSWNGAMQAHGGLDEQYEGLEDDADFLGTGGAGTIFTRQVAFEESTIKEGKGEYPEGTLTIDGGLPVGYYPPPDGTPIEGSWGNEKRKLVLTGEARGYAKSIEFGAIEVLNGSDLTSEFQNQRLEVTAGTLSVDGTSRIDMSDRGYKGGDDGEFFDEPLADAGETAPGVLPATREYGGSHGGSGGTRVTLPGYFDPEEEEGNQPGGTYDSVTEPALPGGGGAGGYDAGEKGNPGGGVLDVTAKTLDLDGRLSADGEDGSGPNVEDPTPFGREGGAGAGGSVLVHVERLTGSGAMQADGGDACLTGGPPSLLPPGEGRCGVTGGTAGGGGGGRLAVYATSCGWTGTLAAQGGIDQAAYEQAHRDAETGEYEWESELEESAFATGQEGSVFFQQEAGSCSEPSQQGGSTEQPGSKAGGSPPVLILATGSKPTAVKASKLIAVKASGKGIELTLACEAQAAGGCVDHGEASIIANGKGKKIVPLGSAAGKVHGKRGKRPKHVKLAAASTTIPAGGEKTMTLKLNATGLSLLAKHSPLTVDLLVKQTSPTKLVLEKRKLKLKARKKRSAHRSRR